MRDDRNGRRESERYFDCDVLIIDDLGTERSTHFPTATVLFNVINTRLCRGSATIINTNLSQKEIRERYDGRTSSRIFGRVPPAAVRRHRLPTAQARALTRPVRRISACRACGRRYRFVIPNFYLREPASVHVIFAPANRTLTYANGQISPRAAQTKVPHGGLING